MIFKPGDPRNPTKRNAAARKARIKPAATGITPAGPATIAIASTATVQNQIAQPEANQTPSKPKQHHVGKSRRELTSRAKTVVRSLIEGANTTQALLNAGYTKSYAVCHKESILANPIMQRTFSQVLEASGLTDSKIADKLASLVDAKEVKYFSNKGEVTDSREVDALSIQLSATELAAKLKGHLAGKNAEAPSHNTYIDLSSYQVMVAGNSPEPIDVAPDQNHPK